MASKAADEMLDLADIEATFVVFYNAQDVVISARSHGKINVQVIMENLGGGGSLALPAHRSAMEMWRMLSSS